MKEIGRVAVAEFIGTFALCFIGAGAVCTNQWTGGGVGLLGIAIAHGAALGVMISALGHVSGGHFNPAVTLAVLSINRLTMKDATCYLIAQVAGAVAAGYLLRSLIPDFVWQPVHLGTPTLGAGITVSQATLLETMLTLLLVLTVFGTAVDPKGSWNAVAGFGIGGVVAADILVGGPITGAAMNPARAFGSALASGHWDYHMVYWFGPILGGLLAAYLYSALFLPAKKR
jgi:aquaporin Z